MSDTLPISLASLPPIVAGAAYVAGHYHFGASAWASRLGVTTNHARAWFARRWSVGLTLLIGALAATGAAGLPLTTAFGITTDASVARAAIATVAITVVFAPIAASSARSPAGRAHYPEVREPDWTPAQRCRNALTWGWFLLGYEAYFRGFWLLWLATVTDVTTALAVHTFIYAIAHLPKPNASETWSTLLMGFVFGIATLWSGSIIAAWLSHWAIGAASESAAIRAQLAR